MTGAALESVGPPGLWPLADGMTVPAHFLISFALCMSYGITPSGFIKQYTACGRLIYYLITMRMGPFLAVLITVSDALDSRQPLVIRGAAICFMMGPAFL